MQKPLTLLLTLPLALAACADQVGPPDAIRSGVPGSVVLDADQGGDNPYAHLLPPVGDPFDQSQLTPEENDLLPYLRVRVTCSDVFDSNGDAVENGCDAAGDLPVHTAENGGLDYGAGEAEYQANIDLRELRASPDDQGQTWVYRATGEISFVPEMGWQELASAELIALADGSAKKKDRSGGEETIATTSAQLPFKLFAENGIGEEALSDGLGFATLDPELQGACQVLDGSGQPICSLTSIPASTARTEASLFEDGNEIAAILFNEQHQDLEEPAILLLSKLSDEDCALGRIPANMVFGTCVAAVMYPEQPLGDAEGDGTFGDGVPGGVCGTLESPASRTVKFDAGRDPEFTLPPRADVSRFLECTEQQAGFLENPLRWLAARTVDFIAPPLFARDLRGAQLNDLSHLIEMEAVVMSKDIGDGAATAGEPHSLQVKFNYDHVDTGDDSALGRTATFTVTAGSGTFLVDNEPSGSIQVMSPDSVATAQFYPAEGTNEITVTSDEALPAEGIVFTVTGEAGTDQPNVIDFETFSGDPTDQLQSPPLVDGEYYGQGAIFSFDPNGNSDSAIHLCPDPSDPSNHALAAGTDACSGFNAGTLVVTPTGNNSTITFSIIRPAQEAGTVTISAAGASLFALGSIAAGDGYTVYTYGVTADGTADIGSISITWSHQELLLLDDLEVAAAPPLNPTD